MDITLIKQMPSNCKLTSEQTAQYFILIEGAKPRPSRIAEDVYTRQVAMAAVRAVRSPQHLDLTDRMLLNMAAVAPKAKTTAAELNPCTRCGGVGSGNWGAVRNGVCFKCGGSGVNS